MSRIFSFLAVALIAATPVLAQQTEVGYASWYNRGFHGLSTTSGEAYDHEALTAAHPELPFGTLVQVTRTDDGRKVTVRINDRMQSGPGHVIDLSGAAARELGLMETGVARVRITRTEIAGASTPSYQPDTGYTNASSVTPTSGSYTLQIGVFSSRNAAEAHAADHEGSWIKSISTANGTMYRVYFGSYTGETAARAAQSRLGSSGIESFLRQVQ